MSEAAISLENLQTTISGEPVLRDLSLEVEPGEFCVVVGPSGCGKSTLLKSVAGLVEPDGGTVTLRGVDVATVPPEERSLGFVFQEFEETLFPHKTVAGNVAFGLRQGNSYTSEEIERRIDEMLELLAIPGTKESVPSELSGGQQQRVELARQLVRECDIVLLDDPLADLDYKLQKRLELEIHRIQREQGHTFVYVTHNQDQALKLADKLVVMNQGAIEQIGSPRDVYSSPETAFVARFVGDSNLFTSTVTRESGSNVVVETGVGELVATPAGDEPPESDGVTDSGVTIVRPETARLGTRAEECENTLEGVLEDQTFSGEYTEYMLSVDGRDRDLLVVEPGRPRFEVTGGAVPVGWSDSDTHYFERLSVTGDVSIGDLEVI